jgi:hypothetical protein
MVKLSKGLVIAAAVAGGLSLAGCASQGTNGACGPAAVPVAAPAPVASCKGMSHCKSKASMSNNQNQGSQDGSNY